MTLGGQNHLQFPASRGLQTGQGDSDPSPREVRGSPLWSVLCVEDPHVVPQGILGRQGRLPGGRHGSFEIRKVDRRRSRGTPKINGILLSHPGKCFRQGCARATTRVGHTPSTVSLSSQIHTQ